MQIHNIFLMRTNCLNLILYIQKPKYPLSRKKSDSKKGRLLYAL